jgi:hypothetical protein
MAKMEPISLGESKMLTFVGWLFVIFGVGLIVKGSHRQDE